MPSYTLPLSYVHYTCIPAAQPTFIFGASTIDHASLSTIGITYALLAALFSGFAYIFVRMLGTIAKMPWPNVCCIQAIGQTILSIPLLLLYESHIQPLHFTLYQITLLISGGLIGTLGQFAMTIGMQREKSATASAMRLSEIIFSFIFQCLFTNDTIDMLSLFGAMLVASSVLIVIWGKSRSVYGSVSGSGKATGTTALPLHSSDKEGEYGSGSGKMGLKVEEGGGVKYDSVPTTEEEEEREEEGISIYANADRGDEGSNNLKNNSIDINHTV